MEFKKKDFVWVSFCISTYKRPLFLNQQLQSILKQSFQNFEIVISDNDPDCSGRDVVKDLRNDKLKYYSNDVNLGMMKSFNKSIERSSGEYIVTITDDDPIVPEMLEKFYELAKKYPNLGIYAGCSRSGKKENDIEIFDNKNFLFQILNPALTKNLLWSSCIIRKDVLLSIGGIPEYGSPHLADHAMIALCGTANGGVIINKMFSEITTHEQNFSKGNIELYSIACKQFYNLISKTVDKNFYIKDGQNIIIKHLDRWFIVAMFSLRKYYTYQNPKKEVIKKIDLESKTILELDFMKHIKIHYYIKLIIFNLKKPLFLAKILH